MLEVAGLLEECCRVASNGAWRSCKSARPRPVHCMKTAARHGHAPDTYFSVYLCPSDCTKLKLLLNSPMGLFSSAHASCCSGFSSSSFVPGGPWAPLPCCTDTAEESRHVSCSCM